MNNTMKKDLIVLIKKDHVQAFVPEYGTEWSACFDLKAVIDTGSVVVPAKGGRIQVDTGLIFAIPEDHVMLLFSRSGHGAKHGVRLGNCVGVIDADYRGRVKAVITNDGDIDFEIKHGERCVQALIIPRPVVSFNVVPVLPETERGAGGFGSTGNN